MLKPPRADDIGPKNVLVPAASDECLNEQQEEALRNIREKLRDRKESCSVLVLSSSSLSRTVMATQLQSRGWTTYTANHLTEGTSVIHHQVSKALARGLSVARDVDDTNSHYSSGGVKIKFADDGAVVRLVLLDCFLHEPLLDVVKGIRLLDEEHKLNMVIGYLSQPRPVEGQGFVLAPRHQVSIAEAYAAGVDIVIPSFFDRSVVEFLTEIFLSSTGRFMKSGATVATGSNFSQIRSLLMDVTDRTTAVVAEPFSIKPSSMHSTDDATGGVPNLEKFSVNNGSPDEKVKLVDDDLETEIEKAQKKELTSRKEKRFMTMQQGPSAIDTNPEYISLLSKYEICLRQLQTNKVQITDLLEAIEVHRKDRDILTKEAADMKIENERLLAAAESAKSDEDSGKRIGGGAAQGYYAQLVQREQKIGLLEKEVAGFKVRFENQKKIADDAVQKSDKFRKEADDAKRYIITLNRRFDERLKALGVAGGSLESDDSVPATPQEDPIHRLHREIHQTRQQLKWRESILQSMELRQLEHADFDVFGKSAQDLISGLRSILSRDEMLDLISSGKKGATQSSPNKVSFPPSSKGDLQPSASMEERGEGDESPTKRERAGSLSVVSVNSDIDNGDEGTEEGDDNGEEEDNGEDQEEGGTDGDDAGAVKRAKKDPAFLGAFGGMDAGQFNDMSAPETIDDSGTRGDCDALVVDALNAVKAGDAVIRAIRQHHKEVSEKRRYHREESTFLSNIRHHSMFRQKGIEKTFSSGAIGPEMVQATLRGSGRQKLDGKIEEVTVIGNRLAGALDNLVETLEQTERQEAAQRKNLETTLADFISLSTKVPCAQYEQTLAKLRVYVLEQIARHELTLQSKPNPQQFEAVVTELARWTLLKEDVDANMAELVAMKQPGGPHHKKKEEIEKRVEMLEHKAIRMIPDMIVSRNYESYLKVQKDVIALKRQLKSLPGGRVSLKRPAVTALSQYAATAQYESPEKSEKVGGSPPASPRISTDFQPFDIIDIVEKALKGEMELTLTSNSETARLIQRKSLALGGDISQLSSLHPDDFSLTSPAHNVVSPLTNSMSSERMSPPQLDLPVAVRVSPRNNISPSDPQTSDPQISALNVDNSGSFRKPLTIAVPGDPNNFPIVVVERSSPPLPLNGSGPPQDDGSRPMTSEGSSVAGPVDPPQKISMQGVANEMLTKFRSYSVVKKSGAVAPLASGHAYKKIVHSLRATVTNKLESVAHDITENVHQFTNNVGEDIEKLMTDTKSFQELDFSKIERLIDKTKDLTTPTTVYQLVLVYHRELVRLFKLLKRRSAITNINIIDAHHLHKVLFKEGRDLTRTQAENIPFLLSVDAAQVMRFADFFEGETEALVREGAAKLQRHVDEKAAELAGLPPRRPSATPNVDALQPPAGDPFLRLPTSQQVRRNSDSSLHLPQEGLRLDCPEATNNRAGSPQTTGDGVRDGELQLQHPNRSSPPFHGHGSTTNSPRAHKDGEEPQKLSSSLVQDYPPKPIDPVGSGRPSPDDVRTATALLLQEQYRVISPRGNGTAPLLSRSGARMAYPVEPVAVLSFTSFGASQATHSDNAQSHGVIYVPRTPQIDWRDSGRRFHASPHVDPNRAAKQKFIDDVVGNIVHNPRCVDASDGTNVVAVSSIPSLPHLGTRLPPPSRQKAAFQQHNIHQPTPKTPRPEVVIKQSHTNNSD